MSDLLVSFTSVSTTVCSKSENETDIIECTGPITPLHMKSTVPG